MSTYINAINSNLASFGALSASSMSGSFNISNIASGSGASSATYFRGDNTWAAPAFSGTLTASTVGYIPIYAVAGTTVSGRSVTTNGVLIANAAGSMAIATPSFNGTILLGNTTGSATLSWFSPTGGSGVTVFAGAGTLSCNCSVVSIGTVTVNTNAVVNRSYSFNATTRPILTLPATSDVGAILNIVSQNTGGWTIGQLAGQSIQVGSVSTTVGTGGSVSSSNKADSMVLVCTVANTSWSVLGAPQSSGLTIV